MSVAMLFSLAHVAAGDEPKPSSVNDQKPAATGEKPGDGKAVNAEQWRYVPRMDCGGIGCRVRSGSIGPTIVGCLTMRKRMPRSRHRAPRTYSYSNNQGGNPQWGFWGPVRYNQYGQPQYPYSQRSGNQLQQLGPVPAAGGVRSLPGWGGELERHHTAKPRWD